MCNSEENMFTMKLALNVGPAGQMNSTYETKE